MKTKNLSFEDFKNEKLSGKEQKMIHGGGEESTEESDTNRGNGKGSM